MANKYEFDFEHEDHDAFLKFLKKEKLGLSVPVVHIAGSNGKSSTANLLAGIYEHAGYNVGLFLNTYFSSPREMIKVNHKDIDEASFSKIELQFAKIFEKFGLSGFQRVFAIALAYFSSLHLDLAIIETGLGGAYDATNILYDDKVLSIITNISLEHTDLLGTTLSQIANEKSGIFADRVPVLLGQVDESCKPTLVDAALGLSCEISSVDDPHNVALKECASFDYGTYLNVELSTKALYMIPNACIAIEATFALRNNFRVKEEDIREGLKTPNLPGRFELIDGVLFDGAENPFAMQGFAKSIFAYAVSGNAHAIFASERGQNIAVELPLIDNYVETVTITTFDNPLARVEDDYFLFAPDYESAPSFMYALAQLQSRFPGELIVVTGSLDFVFSAMKEWRSA